MKLQNLIIIFIIIIIPIVFIFSLYLNLETKTISLQTDYDEKLIEATKEAMEAFEINTVEWKSEFSTLANSKRQDILASINIFSTSLANKLRISGSSKETILTYVPAIVYIMYDGYYIYSPTYVPQTITNDNGVQLFYYKDSGAEGTKITASATQNIKGEIVSGEPLYFAKSGEGTLGKYNGEDIYYTTDVTKAEKTYKHVLKTFVPYTMKYNDYVINYTLDNYIRIFGEDEAKEGYIVDNFYNGGTYRITIPINSISGVKFDGENITPEILTENIAVRNSETEEVQIKEYPYIYNSNNDKRYYDVINDKFFTVNKSYVKVYLPNTDVGTSMAEYKKVVVCTNAMLCEYLELYQLINKKPDNSWDNTWYEINPTNNQYIPSSIQTPNVDRYKDCSAINYCIETHCFNKWLKNKFSDTVIKTILDGRKQCIINNINNNLNLSISNYNANSGIDYKLPELTDKDWEQALSNISIIAFFQGQKIGLKTYNNYAIVTSTENNEYVNENSLYFLDNEDDYYHRYGCKKVASNIERSYRNTEFKAKSYNYKIGTDERSGYYYKHSTVTATGTQISKQQCFDCIVNRNNFMKNGIDGTSYEQLYYTALARERYVQIQRTKLIK